MRDYDYEEYLSDIILGITDEIKDDFIKENLEDMDDIFKEIKFAIKNKMLISTPLLLRTATLQLAHIEKYKTKNEMLGNFKAVETKIFYISKEESDFIKEMIKCASKSAHSFWKQEEENFEKFSSWYEILLRVSEDLKDEFSNLALESLQKYK